MLPRRCLSADKTVSEFLADAEKLKASLDIERGRVVGNDEEEEYPE